MTGVIPITDAKRIGVERKCPIVVIFGIEESAERFTVTTWGRNRELCAWAAKLSGDIKQAVLSGAVCGDTAHAENPYEELKRYRKAMRAALTSRTLDEAKGAVRPLIEEHCDVTTRTPAKQGKRKAICCTDFRGKSATIHASHRHLMSNPPIAFCPFCRSTRLHKSLSSYLCLKCGWWFSVHNVFKEPVDDQVN